MTEAAVITRPPLSEVHHVYLNDHAITDEVIREVLIWSRGDKLCFGWNDSGTATVQTRIWPEPEGGPPPGMPKYLWADGEAGHPSHLWAIRPVKAPEQGEEPGPVIISEGTKQSLAVASWAPAEYAVYGMSGCDGWRNLELARLDRFAGRKVIIMLDADAGDNLNVYEGGEGLAAELRMEEAAQVEFVPSPSWGKGGIDDYLAAVAPTRRQERLAKLLAATAAKPAERKPRNRKVSEDVPDTGGRLMVVVNGDRLGVIQTILGRMRAMYPQQLFSYGGVITRLRGSTTEPLDKDSFARWMAAVTATYKYRPPGLASPGSYEAAWPEPQTIGALLASGDEFPPLDRISRSPFINSTGEIVAKNGYDGWQNQDGSWGGSKTMLVMGNSGMDRLDIPHEPSQAEAAVAASYLMDEWLGDMPWKDGASRANALALALTPFIRGLVPLVPLAVISGLQMGVGKNLLADCLSIMITGDMVQTMPWIPDDDDENRKQILSAFRAGTTLFCLDEAHQIRSTALARAITSTTYSDRILGVSKMASYPNTVTWMALGNQVQVDGDMSRRYYPVELYPEAPDPQDRDESSFTHPDLRGWTQENRPELVTKILTVIRAWYAAGRPPYPRGTLMGSFEPWDKMMSGILGHAGVPGFLENMATRRAERDTQSGYWGEHIAWLRSMFGADEFTSYDVKAKAMASGGNWEPPPRVTNPAADEFTRDLGQGYGQHTDRWYGQFRLVKIGTGHGKKVKWQIQVRDDERTPPIPPTNSVGNYPTVSSGDTLPDLGGRDWRGQIPDVRNVQGHTPLANTMRGLQGEYTLPELGEQQMTNSAEAQSMPTRPAETPQNGGVGGVGGVSSTSPLTYAGARVYTHVREDKGWGYPSDPSTPPGPAIGFDLETADADDIFRTERGYVAEDGAGFVRLAGVVGPAGNRQIVTVRQLLALMKVAGRLDGHNILGFDGLALAQHHGMDWQEFAAKARDSELIARQVNPPRSRESGSSQDKYDLDHVAAGLGVAGKGHPHGTGILTPAGFVPVEELVPGDLVTGSDGQPVKVHDTYRRGVLPVYRVIFSDGSSVRVDGDHLWAARTSAMAQKNGAYRDMETRELALVLHKRWEIPQVSAPVEMTGRDLPVDPYIMGVLLGDGALTQARASFTPGDARVPAEVARRLPEELVLHRDQAKPGKADSWRIVRADGLSGRLPGGEYVRNPVVLALESLGLTGKPAAGKFVPGDYLYSSSSQRLDLLRGLMDTDGHLYRDHGRPVLTTGFSSASERLCDQVRFLVESFGGTARKRVKHAPEYTYRGAHRTGQPSYALSISMPVSPFLTREDWKPNERKKPKRIIDSIEPDGEAEVTCLRVDAADSLYVTEHCIVTHNTDNLARLARVHGGWDKIPLNDAEYRSYLFGDLGATRAVSDGLNPYYDADPYLAREHKLAAIAGQMTLNGFAVDRELLAERAAATSGRKRQALGVLHSGWGLPLTKPVMRGRGDARHEEQEPMESPLATDIGRDWLAGQWERYGIPSPPLTDTGKLAIGGDDLKRVASDPRCPAELKTMLTLMGIVTASRTVYQTATDWLCPDGRVHPKVSMRQASGRWSVTKPGLTVFGKRGGKHVERQIFLPDPGHVLLSFDLSQVDMRAMAGHSQDPAYMDMFGFEADGKPKDAHKWIAMQVGLDRQDAKVISHGWNYGLGAKSMIRDGLDPEKVWRFINGMEARFPRLIGWREEIRAQGKDGMILDNGFGRRMRCEPSRAYTVAPALMGQGGARDIMCECLLRLPAWTYPFLRAMVHDEIVMSVPAEAVQDVIRVVNEAMTWRWRGVDILCDMTGPGANWAEISSK